MEDFRSRLKKARDALGLSQNAAAKKGGVAQHMWTRYESGAIAVPPYTFIEALSRLGINANWVLIGIGEMFVENSQAVKGKRIPLLALAGAGTYQVDEPLPYEDMEELILPPSVPLPKGEVYLIKVRGMSMLPDYQDGDYLVVAEEEHPRKGKPYVFVADGTTWLKTYSPNPSGGVELTSSNSLTKIRVEKRLRAFKLVYHMRKPRQ